MAIRFLYVKMEIADDEVEEIDKYLLKTRFEVRPKEFTVVTYTDGGGGEPLYSYRAASGERAEEEVVNIK